jgi:hypothetical protein
MSLPEWMKDRGTDKAPADSVTGMGLLNETQGPGAVRRIDDDIPEETPVPIKPLTRPRPQTSAEREPMPMSRRMKKARADLEKAQALQAQWEAEAAAKELELADFEQHMSEQILLAPEADRDAVAARLMAQTAELRAAVASDWRRKTAKEAAARVPELSRAVLRAEADDVREELDAKRKVLTEHETRTAELLAVLVKHEGGRFVQQPPPEPNSMFDGDPPPAAKPVVSRMLRREVGQLAMRLVLLELAAAGQKLPMFFLNNQIPPRSFSPLMRGTDAIVPDLMAPAGPGLHLGIYDHPTILRRELLQEATWGVDGVFG